MENRPWRTDVPAKCRFEKASIDAYPPNSFDFILMRNPRVEDEPNLFQQVRKLLLPGGYVQFVFIDRNICTCGSTAEWKQAKMCEICNKFRGTTILERFLVSWFRSTTNRKRLLADAGFESITTVSTGHYYSCPLDNSKATWYAEPNFGTRHMS